MKRQHRSGKERRRGKYLRCNNHTELVPDERDANECRSIRID